MTEQTIHTLQSLADDFAALGLQAGQTVLVHSSLKRVGGWICGGPPVVIQALLQVLGADGTLMMPTHSSDNTNPANWQNPPVPESWWPIIRQQMPAYDPATAPTRMMGILPDTLRYWPGAIRSHHPIGSFTAVGKHAAYLTENHILEPMFGDETPIGKLYALDGHVMLLGVGHGNNTSLHLAEYRATFPGKAYQTEGTAMLVNGQRQWVEFEMLALEDEDFPQIGADYEKINHAKLDHAVTIGHIGQAETRFFKQCPIVDFAVTWMQTKRDFRAT